MFDTVVVTARRVLSLKLAKGTFVFLKAEYSWVSFVQS